MNFYDSMKNTVDNVSITENGMVGYKTTNHELLDFNFKIASYRNNITSGVEDFKKVLKSKEQYALKFLFYLRDAREGIGERALFKACLKEFVNCDTISNKNEIVNTIIDNIPTYGRYDDLFVLLDSKYDNLVLEKCRRQLSEDFENYKNGKSISLLAKWMPSVNASKKTRKLALRFVKYFKTTEREYRTMLSTLRSHLKIVERDMCAKKWGDIDYSAVPSKANLKYGDAFLRNDEGRRRDFLAKLRVGDKTVHINSSVNFPHEIVTKYGYSGYHAVNYREDLEQLWKALKPCEGLKDTIVVRDGSGSMTSEIGNSKTTALDVATALAIYCSEHTNSAFKDKFITFSSRAKLVDLSKSESLASKLDECSKYDDCSTTNLENVFELILHTAIENDMKQEDIPSTVLVISDMEFNPAKTTNSYWNTSMNFSSNVIKTVSAKFAAHGYKLPKLAFWNVNSRTGTIPCKQNENGVVLISGFSQNVISMVMNGENDPYVALVKELDKERYNAIPLVEYCASSEPKTKQTKTPDFLLTK